MGPTVSLILQTHNHERFVEEALLSLLDQDVRADYEIIVVDDASTDGTARVVREVDSPRIRLIENAANLGAAASFNTAFASTTGRWVARLDGDDRWRPNWLSSTLCALDEHPDAPLAYGNVAVIDADGGWVQDRPEWVDRLPSNRQDQMLRLLRAYCVPAPTILACRDAWQHALPIPTSSTNNPDWPGSLKMAELGPFCYVDRVLADYRHHEGNFSRQIPTDCSKERAVLEVLNALYSRLPAIEWPDVHRQRRAVYALAYRNAAASYNLPHLRRHAVRCLVQAARLQPDARAVRLGMSILKGAVRDRLRDA